MAGQVVRVKRETLEACMTCPLCKKLLKEATTISLCLHTCKFFFFLNGSFSHSFLPFVSLLFLFVLHVFPLLGFFTFSCFIIWVAANFSPSVAF